MGEQLVSATLRPIGAFDSQAMAAGVPGLPEGFVWKQQRHHIRLVQSSWKEYDHDRTHGSSERYLRKHWWTLLMDSGEQWKVYLTRQPGSRRGFRQRWWLYSRRTPEVPAATRGD